MLRWLSLATVFWIVISTECSQDTFEVTENGSDKRKISPRGYYGLGFAEPLTILAGLAFLAYIIQVFHALYFHGLGGLGGLGGVGGLGGLGGGLGGGLLPSKGKDLLPEKDYEMKLINTETEVYPDKKDR